MGEVGAEIAELRPPTASAIDAFSGGAYVSPSEWATLTAIATTISKTEFVPTGLRGRPAAILAALLFGRDQGVPPSVALSSIHVIDGRPSMAGALLVAKIRKQGGKFQREELRDEDGNFRGVRLTGGRADTGETDTVTFTLEMAARAKLIVKDNWQKFPEMMCYWRCVSMLARTLFADVFLGVPVYVHEELEGTERSVDAAARGQGDHAGPPELDFGPDETVAARLAQLFAYANEVKPGSYRPAKQAALLRECESLDDRELLVGVLENFIVEVGHDVPEPVIEAEAIEEEQSELPIEEVLVKDDQPEEAATD